MHMSASRIFPFHRGSRLLLGSLLIFSLIFLFLTGVINVSTNNKSRVFNRELAVTQLTPAVPNPTSLSESRAAVAGRSRGKELPTKCNDSLRDFLRPTRPPQPAPDRRAGDKKCFNLLLIIIFNSPLYDHAPFLRKMYEPGFTKVVMYGPKADEKFNIVGSPRLAGPGCFIPGCFFHRSIAQAMVENPGYDGYLWMADDDYFNYKRALTLYDPQKVWICASYMSHGESIFNKNLTDWWWAKNISLPKLREIYECLPGKYFDRSRERYGCDNCVIAVPSDWGYVPKRLVNDFLYLIYALRDVFIEITLATVLFLIPEEKSAIQQMTWNDTMFLWEQKRKIGDVLEPVAKKPDLILYHPLKVYRKVRLQRRILDMWRSWGRDTPYSIPDWLKCSR